MPLDLSRFLVKINGIEYCEDEQRMEEVARDFGNYSNHLFGGCIGAIDGWIVKIKQPGKSNNASNPKSFYRRKGFHGISVQAIVDRKKRILFWSIESRGAEHDSTAFKRTGLYQWLLENWWRLERDGYYFIGDSAYALHQFIITPYDNAMHGTPKDNFNFSIHCQELLLNVPLEKSISAGEYCGVHCSSHWH